MDGDFDHHLIEITPYASATRPHSRIAEAGPRSRSPEANPLPDRERRSIHLGPKDGNSVRQGAAQGLSWPGGEIRDVKVVLVVTDQRIAFAVPKCPKPVADDGTTSEVWIGGASLVALYPFMWLYRYAAEAKRHARQIGLGHIHYEWITSVQSQYQDRGRRRRPGRQRHGDIVEVCYRSPSDVSGDDATLTPTGQQSSLRIGEVYFELAPDLSGEMLAMELAARVCRFRLTMFRATSREFAEIDTVESLLNKIKNDIATFPETTNRRLRYEIPL